MKYLLLTLFTLTCIACNRKNKKTGPLQCNYQCVNPSIVPYFTGYKQDEIDTVVLKTFDTADYTFKHVLSEKQYYHPDTINVGYRTKYSDSTIAFSSALNYQIAVPATGKIYKINMNTQQLSELYSCDETHYCPNTVSMSLVDAAPIQLEAVYQNFIYAIQLKK